MADEDELASLIGRLTAAELVYVVWREPDMGDAITAVAIEPGEATSRLVANLPLTGRETVMA